LGQILRVPVVKAVSSSSGLADTLDDKTATLEHQRVFLNS
jgi:hypothetical protein